MLRSIDEIKQKFGIMCNVMEFLVDYDEMTTLDFGIQGKLSSWGEQLHSIQEPMNSFIQMDTF